MVNFLNISVEKLPKGSPFKQAVIMLLFIVFALILGGIMMALVKADPIQGYRALIQGAIGSSYSISETITRTIPLLFIGLGTIVCFRAGVWNIGGDGQIYAGGIAATAIGLYLGNFPPVILILLTIVVGALGGAIWSGLAGLLKIKFNINEIFSTLMLNYVIYYFTIFLLEEVWREGTFGMAWSEILPKNSWWPLLVARSRIHIGLVLAVLSAVLSYFLIFRSSFGYKLRSLGINPRASLCKYKKRSVNRTILLCMVIAGIMGGLAGAGQVLGNQHRLTLSINTNYGFLGIIVALLSGLNPVGVVFSSFCLSAILTGSSNMQVESGVPVSLIDIIIGLILIGAISATIISRYRIHFKKRTYKRQESQ